MSDIGSITDVAGIEVGHYTDERAGTGCTVVLSRAGAMAGVDVRGSAPATRETDLLRVSSLVDEIHGVLLTGGSVFGLDAAAGVERYLERESVGIEFAGHTIPIVPGAALFDLGICDSSIRPGSTEGFKCCEQASIKPASEGSVGAGTGATVSKFNGIANSVKGGVGSASVEIGGGVVVGALMAVNAIGDIVEAATGRLVAGSRCDNGSMRRSMDSLIDPSQHLGRSFSLGNTTIGVVATNAKLTKSQTNKLAEIAHDGIALAVRPAHTMSDGDTLFTLSTGMIEDKVNMYRLGAAAVEVTSRAIVRGVTQAKGLGGIPSISGLDI